MAKLVKGDGPKDAEFAVGGGELDRARDFKKADPQGRGDYGRFLSTKDRFTGKTETDRVSDSRRSQSSAEDWAKPKGVGTTDEDDIGDTKKLKAIKPKR